MLFKKDTASQVYMFYLVLSSDHLTAATGKTSITLQASKNGAAFAAIGGAITEIGNGWYKSTFDATHTNTAGGLAIRATQADCDTWNDDSQVLTALPGDPVDVGTVKTKTFADADAFAEFISDWVWRRKLSTIAASTDGDSIGTAPTMEHGTAFGAIAMLAGSITPSGVNVPVLDDTDATLFTRTRTTGSGDFTTSLT